MSKKYIFAIDETGCFAIKNDSWSFTCGVSINANENDLRQAYKKIYEDFGFPAPTPSDIEGLLKTTDDIHDNARFHANRMSKEQREICRKHLAPFVEKIYVSKDKPVLYANNQNWWLIAITVIIREYLRDLELQKDDVVEIWIDNRSQKVWGIENDDDNLKFKEYHNIIKSQIENNVKDYVKNPDCLQIEFRSDTSSFFINLADIFCKMVAKDRDSVIDILEECSCKNFNSGMDPVAYKSRNPLLALNIIYQEVDANKFDNVSLLADILSHLRNDHDDYEMAWDMFHDFLKSKIKERKTDSQLVTLSDFVKIFFKEFESAAKQRISASRCLEQIVLFEEYFSHTGDIENPIKRDDFVKMLLHCDRNTETRTLRKWEKLLSYTLRESQIYFNAYNFDAAKKNLEETWEKQENLIKVLKNILYERDEPTAALIGSLAQSHAYKNELDEAIEYFNISKDYSIKSTNKTDSYLLAIYHRRQDVEKTRECFAAQNETTPEDYYKNGKFDDTWKLLSYFKLRALELYKGGKTDLPNIDITTLKNYNCEYPFPMVMKWNAIALWLEDKAANRDKVEKLFADAIENLLRADNGFAINTLALPIMQCYSFVNNKNPYHSRYDAIVVDLKKRSSYFEEYVEEHVHFLSNIKNEAEFWERAMSLPFIYS